MAICIFFPLFSFFFLLLRHCDMESCCAIHIQMLFKSVSPHLHVKLRIWCQVACILIRGTIFNKVEGLKLQINGTGYQQLARQDTAVYCTLILRSFFFRPHPLMISKHLRLSFMGNLYIALILKKKKCSTQIF